MKKFGIEIKWGIIFTIVALIWMVLEKSMGWHDEHIDKYHIYTNFFAIVAILIYVLALIDKRKKSYNGKMTWFQGFRAGVAIAVVVAILSPFSQYVTHNYISPEYFPNVISYSVESGKMTQDEAEAYFNIKKYIVQSLIFALIIGTITSAIVAVFVRKK